MESREIRGSRTSVRETIGLIPGGAGTVVVVCDLVECVEPLTADKVRKNAKKDARIGAELGWYRRTLEKRRILKLPVPYHLSGAIV